MGGAGELEARDIFGEFFGSGPRVLADIFAVGFVAELLHQRRIEGFVQVVVDWADGLFWVGH
jgi:hypothetical protein